MEPYSPRLKKPDQLEVIKEYFGVIHVYHGCVPWKPYSPRLKKTQSVEGFKQAWENGGGMNVKIKRKKGDLSIGISTEFPSRRGTCKYNVERISLLTAPSVRPSRGSS